MSSVTLGEMREGLEAVLDPNIGQSSQANTVKEASAVRACSLGVKSALLAYITIGALSHEY